MEGDKVKEYLDDGDVFARLQKKENAFTKKPPVVDYATFKPETSGKMPAKMNPNLNERLIEYQKLQIDKMAGRADQKVEMESKYTPGVPDLAKDLPKELQDKFASSSEMQARVEPG